MSVPLARIENLEVSFPGRAGRVAVVEDVSLEIRAGEVLALVGESGCGKSTTAQALVGLHQATSGSIRFFTGSKRCT